MATKLLRDTTKVRKTTRWNLRVSPSQNAIIRQAAEAKGATVTDFVLEAASLAAEHALADRTRFVLNKRAWKEFLDALDRPASVHPRLERLLSEPSVLDR